MRTAMIISLALGSVAMAQPFSGSVTNSDWCVGNPCGAFTETISGVPTAATSDATFNIQIQGDFSFPSSEFVDIVIEGVTIGQHNPGTGDCGGLGTEDFTIPLSSLSGIVADGQVDIDITPGSGVNDFCNPVEVTLTITYEADAAAAPATSTTGLLILVALVMGSSVVFLGRSA